MRLAARTRSTLGVAPIGPDTSGLRPIRSRPPRTPTRIPVATQHHRCVPRNAVCADSAHAQVERSGNGYAAAMTAASDHASADAVELGPLLVLLHGADAPIDTVEAIYRLWRHRERAHAAFLADAEEQKRRGASITLYGPGRAEPEAAEYEETVRIWRAGERADDWGSVIRVGGAVLVWQASWRAWRFAYRPRRLAFAHLFRRGG